MFSRVRKNALLREQRGGAKTAFWENEKREGRCRKKNSRWIVIREEYPMKAAR